MTRSAEQLRDEISLRKASLADARREHDAGELTSAQFDAISLREHSAIERVQRALAEMVPLATPVLRPRIRRTRWLVVALACFALALGVTLWAALTPRQPGTSITGSISLSHAQRISQLLSEAQADTANGDDVAALSAYQSVLSLDANNVAALAQSGWLDFSAGSADHNVSVINLGVTNLRRAITLSPHDPAPRLYYAIVADSIPGNQALAKTQFEEFLASHPSVAQMAIAQPFLKKLGLA